MALNITPQSGTLKCTIKSLNIRKGAPNTTASIVGKLTMGQQVRFNGIVLDGQSVSGQTKWFRDENGNFIWSGGVQVVQLDPPPSSTDSSANISAAVGAGSPNKKEDVLLVQKLLNAKGFQLKEDGLFGTNTGNAIKDFQKGALGFNNTDGRVDVGGKTWQGLNDPNVHYTPAPPTSSGDFNTKYKDVVFQGSVFPDAPVRTNLSVKLNDSMTNIYLPAMERALAGSPKGLKLLCTVMASHEGFYPGSRSFRTNNPGNIGNTDAGTNVSITNLDAGIVRQRDYINRIVQGKNTSYPIGKTKLIPSFYSQEIADNPQYGLPAWLPGYNFVFTGQLDQFVKIYSTGARAGNSYLSTILSYLIANGINVTASSTLAEVISDN